jgi:hypothetical protein
MTLSESSQPDQIVSDATGFAILSFGCVGRVTPAIATPDISTSLPFEKTRQNLCRFLRYRVQWRV